MPQQSHGFKQEIIKVEGIRLTQTLFIHFVDLGKAQRLGIRRGLIPFLRELAMVLAVADARKGCAIWHEFFVKSELLINRFDQCELVVIIIDGELTCKSVPNFRQSIAIAAQQTHTKGVKRTDSSRPRGLVIPSSLLTRCRISSAALLVNVTASI